MCVHEVIQSDTASGKFEFGRSGKCAVTLRLLHTAGSSTRPFSSSASSSSFSSSSPSSSSTASSSSPSSASSSSSSSSSSTASSSSTNQVCFYLEALASTRAVLSVISSPLLVRVYKPHDTSRKERKKKEKRKREKENRKKKEIRGCS